MRRTSSLFHVVLGALMLVSAVSTQIAGGQTKPATAATTRPTGPARFEKEIAAFEAADRANPPAKGAIVFTGSSTIRGWKTLSRDFPDHHVLNRGFGGSQIEHATHFAERIIVPYEPKMVFLRSGGNDIAANKSPERVFEDYKEFVAKVRSKLPDTTIVFIGLAPAPVRWEQRDKNKRLNQLVEAYTRETPGLMYIETYDTTVNPDGTPREELFVKDRLHFNPEGYKLLAERVRPFLPK